MGNDGTDWPDGYEGPPPTSLLTAEDYAELRAEFGRHEEVTPEPPAHLFEGAIGTPMNGGPQLQHRETSSSEETEIFPLCDIAAWDDTVPQPKTFVLERFIPKGEITLLSGVKGSSKSLFGEQLAIAFAAGLPMLGVPTTGGSALYLTAEDDERELQWRGHHIAKALGIRFVGLAGRLMISSIRGRLENQLATFSHEGRMTTTKAFAALRSTIAATRPDTLVLDNVAHLYGGNENDRVQVTAFLNLLYSLVREFGVTIVLVAHPNKAGDDYSGSTAWVNAVRSHVVIKKPEDATDPDLREMTVGFANYARTGSSTAVAFRWHDFALILDQDLPPTIAEEMAANAKANHDNEVFLACLRLRNKQRRAVSEKAGVNYAPTVFDKMVESRKIGKDRLADAMERLYRIGAIGRDVLWRDEVQRRDVSGLKEARKVTDPSGSSAHQTPPERIKRLGADDASNAHQTASGHSVADASNAHQTNPPYFVGEEPDGFSPPTFGDNSQAEPPEGDDE